MQRKQIMVFQKNQFTVPQVVEGFRAAGLSSVDPLSLVPSDKNFSVLLNKLGSTRQSDGLRRGLRKFLIQHSQKIVSLLNITCEGVGNGEGIKGDGEDDYQSVHFGADDILESNAADCDIACTDRESNDSFHGDKNKDAKRICSGVSENNGNCCIILSSDGEGSSAKAECNDDHGYTLHCMDTDGNQSCEASVTQSNVQSIVFGEDHEGSNRDVKCSNDHSYAKSDNNLTSIAKRMARAFIRTSSESKSESRDNLDCMDVDAKPISKSGATHSDITLHQSQTVCSSRARIEGNKLSWSGEMEEIGLFSIREERWKEIWDSNKKTFKPYDYTSIFGEAISEAKICKCVVLVKSTRPNVNNLISYCYCPSPGCKTFIIRSAGLPKVGEPLVCTLVGKGMQNHEDHVVIVRGKKYERNVSGLIRNEFKEVLSSKKPFNFRREKIRNTSEEEILDGNLCNVRSLETLRKIRSENLTKDDEDPDDVISAIKDWKKKLSDHLPDDDPKERNRHLFLRSVGVPMHAHMISIEELVLFLTHIEVNLSQQMGPVLCFDASSSLVRTHLVPNVRGWRNFYYVMCFRLLSKIITLCTGVLSQQDACHIIMLLLELKFFLLNHGQWPVLNNLIVIDGSYPLLYAVLFVFNNMTLIAYLIYCYKRIHGIRETGYYEVPVEEITVVRADCAHKMKNFAQTLHSVAPKISKHPANRKVMLKTLGALFMCTNYESVKAVFTFLFVVLLNKNVNDEVTKAVTAMEALGNDEETEGYISGQNEPIICDLATSKEAVTEEEKFEAKRLYQQSPFYRDIHEIFRKVSALIQKESSTEKADVKDKKVMNQFYSPKFAEYLLKKQAPTLCLWTGIIRREKFPEDPIRFSTGVVECRMKIVKTDILEGEKNMKLNRFYGRMREEVLDTYKECASKLVPLPKTQKNDEKKKEKKKVSKRISIKKKYNKAKSLLKCPNKSKSKSAKAFDFPSMLEEEQWKVTGSSNKPSHETLIPSEEVNVQTEAMEVESFDVKGEGKAMELEVIEIREQSTNSTCTSPTSSELNPECTAVQRSPTQLFNVGTVLFSDWNKASHEEVNNLLLFNGLINDPLYYKPIADRLSRGDFYDYPISRNEAYSAKVVTFSDFATLSRGRWLNGFIMDAVVETFLGKQGPTFHAYIPSTYSTDILNGVCTDVRYKRAQKILTETRGKRFVIMFYNMRRNHWCVFIADLLDRVIFVFDPMMQYSEKDITAVKKLWTNLQKFVKVIIGNCTVGPKTWKIVSPIHPLQEDYDNCGAFCLFYVLTIIEDSQDLYDMPKTAFHVEGCDGRPFDPNVWRIFCQKLLLEESSSVSNFCAACNDRTIINSVRKCTICLRWVHNKTSCLNFFPIQSAEYPDVCLLCRSYFKSGMSMSTHSGKREEVHGKMELNCELQSTEEYIPPYDVDDLFSFQEEDNIKTAEQPQFINYDNWKKVKDTYVPGTQIPLYVARNPFPAPEHYNSSRPLCFSMLSNGTIDCLKYYIPVHRNDDKMLNYAVASLPSPNLLCGDVCFQEFFSLHENQWMEDTVVDIIACLFIKLFKGKNLKVHYIPSNFSKTILSASLKDRYSEYKFDEIEPFPMDSDYFIMIEHRGAMHWCLLIIDRFKNTLYYMDPFGGNYEIINGEQIVDQLMQNNDKYRFSVSAPLRLETVEHVRQKSSDTTNCGAYCLFFLENFLKHDALRKGDDKLNAVQQQELDISDIFDPVAYRKLLQRTLLWHSEDVSDICFVCNIDDVRSDVCMKRTGDRFVKCMECEKLVHLDKYCLQLPEVEEDADLMEMSDFYCIVCRSHRKRRQNIFSGPTSNDFIDKQEAAREKRIIHRKKESARASNRLLSWY